MIVLLLRPFSVIVFTSFKRSWQDFGYILPVVLRLFWILLSGLEKRRVVRGNGLQGYQVSYDDSLASLEAGYWCVSLVVEGVHSQMELVNSGAA
jgi:hypothetical protein